MPNSYGITRRAENALPMLLVLAAAIGFYLASARSRISRRINTPR